MNMKKLSFISMLFVLLVLIIPFKASAATVGQRLTVPEDGWRRFDDKEKGFQYNGTWNTNPYTDYESGTCRYSSVVGDTICFKFYGTKLRIINQINPYASKNTLITIDGVNYTYSEYSSTRGEPPYVRFLVFEKLGLAQGVHTVTITVTNSDTTRFDAIDIDNNGYLIDPNTPQNVIATAGDTTVKLSWDKVGNASGYTIMRSEVMGGPYEIVTTDITNTSYTDTNLKNDTAYYYVVSAKVMGEDSINSTEVTATPKSQVVSGNSAILIITMTNGNVKEYALTSTELENFLTWYDNSSIGLSKPYFVFTKKTNISPYISKKEYISFDKISSFEVNEFNQ